MRIWKELMNFIGNWSNQNNLSNEISGIWESYILKLSLGLPKWKLLNYKWIIWYSPTRCFLNITQKANKQTHIYTY